MAIRYTKGVTAARNAKRLPNLKQELQVLRRQQKAIAQKIERREQLLEDASHYAEEGHCVDGVHFTMYEYDSIYGGNNYNYAGWDSDRWARIYVNAHNLTTYGVEIGECNKPRFRFGNSMWLGANHTLEEAKKLAEDWIIREEHPER